jgi:hypothetical protein
VSKEKGKVAWFFGLSVSVLSRLPGLDKPYLTVSVAFEWPHQLNFLRFICFDFFSRKLAEE